MQWLEQLDIAALLAAAAAWVRRLDSEFFAAALGFLLLIALIIFSGMYAQDRLSRWLRRQRPVPMNELTPGYHMVQGKARGPILASPFTSQPCVWWQIYVWEIRVQIVSRPDSKESWEREYEAVWREVRHEVSDKPIQCTQGLLSCALQPAGTTMAVPSEVREWEGPGPEPTDRSPPARRDAEPPGYSLKVHNYSLIGGELKRENRYRYAEEIIFPGSELFVLGQVEPADSAQASGDASAVSWRVGPAAGSSLFHQPYVVSVWPFAQVQAQSAVAEMSRAAPVLAVICLAIAGFLIWARLSG